MIYKLVLNNEVKHLVFTGGVYLNKNEVGNDKTEEVNFIVPIVVIALIMLEYYIIKY